MRAWVWGLKQLFFLTIWMKFCKKRWKLKLLSAGRLVIIVFGRLSSILLCSRDRFFGIFPRLGEGTKADKLACPDGVKRKDKGVFFFFLNTAKVRETQGNNENVANPRVSHLPPLCDLNSSNLHKVKA